MKKLIFGLAMALVLVNCNKEKNQPNLSKQNGPAFQTSEEQKLTPVETDKITIENGVLSFESVAFYQSIADFEDYSKISFTVNHLNSLTFNSFGKANPTSKLFSDEFIGAILNKDQIVKIGDWLIKINPSTQKVFAISSQVENAYNLVVSEKETNSSMLTFSTTENVLEALSGNQTKCSEDGVGEREDYCYYVPGPTSNSNRCYLRHKKFGIYFKIQTECTSPLLPNQYFWITYSTKQYKKKCDAAVYMSPGTVWSPLTQFGGWNDVLAQGTTNFSKYWVTITAAGICTYNQFTGVNSYDANINCMLQIKVNW